MTNKYIRIGCIAIGILFLISIATPVLASVDGEDTGIVKDGDGFKGVYEKAKPPGTPGGGGGGGGGGGKPPEPPAVDKWAVVIGIADYKGIGNDLLYTDDDAVDMYNYLISKDYPEDNIKLLLNAKASARNILKAIDWMNGKEEKTTSECVFFYSGHGSTYDGYDDGDDEYTDEAIVTADLYLILDGQLRAKFSSFASEKIAFIFDSCYSGGMDDIAGTGRVVVTACAEEELSYDGTAAMQNGVFTYHYVGHSGSGLYTYNTVEEAFDYAAPLATADAYYLYGATMNPQIFDNYGGLWTF
ncbi:MAG: caspase family protein [Thermoplasmata archaeon]|nr:MAG: caspase family protein [Thermoplasmata archaeon]